MVVVQVLAIQRRRVICGSAALLRDRLRLGAKPSGGSFRGAFNEDALLTLMIEFHVEGGSAPGIPHGSGDWKMQEDHAFGGLARNDHGFAKQGFRG